MRWTRIGVPRGQGSGQAATIAILNEEFPSGSKQATNQPPVALDQAR
jgi:hypothetical protein